MIPEKSKVYEIEYADDEASYCGLARCISDGPSNEDLNDCNVYLYAFEIIDSIEDIKGSFAEFAAEDIIREVYKELA